MRDLFSQMELLTISPERGEALGRREKLQDCSSPVQSSCTSGRSFWPNWKIFSQKCSFQKKEVFTWRKSQKRAAVIVYSWVASWAVQSLCLGRAMVAGTPRSRGRHLCIAQVVHEENMISEAASVNCGYTRAGRRCRIYAFSFWKRENHRKTLKWKGNK